MTLEIINQKKTDFRLSDVSIHTSFNQIRFGSLMNELKRKKLKSQKDVIMYLWNYVVYCEMLKKNCATRES